MRSASLFPRILRLAVIFTALMALSACAQLPRKNVVEGPTTAPPQLQKEKNGKKKE